MSYKQSATKLSGWSTEPLNSLDRRSASCRPTRIFIAMLGLSGQERTKLGCHPTGEQHLDAKRSVIRYGCDERRECSTAIGQELWGANWIKTLRSRSIACASRARH